MSDQFVRDVDDSMREERLKALWEEYGSSLIWGIIIAIALTIAVTGWRGWNHSVNTEQTIKLLQAIDQNKSPQEKIEVANTLRPDQRALLLSRTAAEYLAEGNKEGALKIYAMLAADNAIPSEFSSLAKIMLFRAQQSEKPDNYLYLEDMFQIAANQNGPWWPLASIELAVYTAHVKYDYEGAISYLEPVIGDQNLSKSLRGRASALKHVYKIESAKAVLKEPARGAL